MRLALPVIRWRSIGGKTDGLAEMGSQATQQINSIIDLSKSMESVISATALRSFVEMAKLDHQVYKFDVYQVLMGNSAITADELSQHSECRLGQWYYAGEGKNCFADLAGYRDIEKPHKELHSHSAEAIRRFAEGDIDQVTIELAAMENASIRVIDALERVAQSCEAQKFSSTSAETALQTPN